MRRVRRKRNPLVCLTFGMLFWKWSKYLKVQVIHYLDAATSGN